MMTDRVPLASAVGEGVSGHGIFGSREGRENIVRIIFAYVERLEKDRTEIVAHQSRLWSLYLDSPDLRAVTKGSSPNA